MNRQWNEQEKADLYSPSIQRCQGEFLQTRVGVSLYKPDMDMKSEQTERLLLTILQSIGDAVITTEGDGHVTYMNPLAEALTGWKFENAEGKSLKRIFNITKGPVQYPVHVEAGDNYPLNIPDDTKLISKDGKKIPIDMNVVPLTDDKKELSGQVIVFRDITERKRIEEERQKIHAQLIRAQKTSALGKLAAGVAHDFNNLMTVIQVIAEMGIEQNDKKDHPLYGDLKQIQTAAERAAKLTRQLLIYSRKQSVNPTLLDINMTVDSLLKMLQRLIGENIAISTDMESNVWKILADEGNIEQIIMNLIINARDAMPNGGDINVQTKNVDLGEDDLMADTNVRPGQFVCLSIRDTGKGMNSKTMRRIFEPFFSNKRKGTGLGLSVVYDIVQQHEGFIDVQSKMGKGSSFNIYLPVASTQCESHHNQKIFPKALRGKGERILIVEDEKLLCRLVARVLRQNGYKVITASNTEEAGEIFNREEKKFHLVLSDVVLPDGNGLALVDGFRSYQPDLHVLLSSGYLNSKWYWTEIQKRGFPFLHKPYSIPVLLQTVKDAIQLDPAKYS